MSVLETVLSGLDATTVIIFLVVFLIGYHWLTTPPNLPPGPVGFPVVGNMPSIIRHGADFLSQITKWRQQYGDIFTLKLGGNFVIFINTYEIMYNAFVKQADVFSARATHLYTTHRAAEITGTGVILSEGPTWKQLRRLTLTSLRDLGFGKKTVEQRVHEEARAVVDILEKGQGQPVLCRPLLAKFSSNIICSLALGNRFGYEDAAFKQLTTRINDLLVTQSVFSTVNCVPLLRFLPVFGKMTDRISHLFIGIDSFLESILKDHEATYDPTQVRDFVDLYIKTREETKDSRLYSASNMRRVIVDLLIAGTDTTSATLDWIIMYLIAHPEVQKRCQQEVDRVLGQGRLAMVEDRKAMPYTMAVITETMRISPVFPFGVPHCTKEGGKLGGFMIPPKSIVLSNIREIHHDPTAWPEPRVFKPERFLDKDGNFRPPKDSFVPFSNGPRMCLGESLANMEVFILCVTLLQCFTFTMPQGHKIDLEGVFGFTFTTKPQHVLATRR